MYEDDDDGGEQAPAMITFSEDELNPLKDRPIGAIGRMHHGDDGPSGVVAWSLTSDQEAFDKAREQKGAKTMKVTRMRALKQNLAKRERGAVIGASKFIEMPEIPEEERARCYGSGADFSAKIIQLPDSVFQSVDRGIANLRRTKGANVLLYKGGTSNVPRDVWNHKFPGVFDNYNNDRCDLLRDLVPEGLHVVRDGVDLTEAAIENRKNTIPIRGGYGIRNAQQKGQGAYAFRLCRLSQVAYRRALEAADRTPNSGGTVTPQKPMIYKYELLQLAAALQGEIHTALQSGDKHISTRGYSTVSIEVDYWQRTIQDILYSIFYLFQVAEGIKGLEEHLWKHQDYDCGHSFANDLLKIWRARECYFDWIEKEKYSGLKQLWDTYLEKYCKRCVRREKQLEREDKKRQERLAAEREAKKKEKAEQNEEAA